MPRSEPDSDGPVAPPRPARSPWPALAVAVAMLAASGGVRAWQGRGLVAAERAAERSPFSLNQLPRVIGAWRARGEDMALDAKTLEIAGCSDYVTRAYVDDRTGVTATVLVAYGPAERVVGHTPAVCFPAVGYERIAGPVDRPIEAGAATARARSFVFAKPGAADPQRTNVYVAFRHGGRWTPDASDGRKQFRRDPGMFKIQVQRRVGPGERCEAGNPSEQLAAALIAEVEREIAGARR